MYKEDLALNNVQWLICHKPNQDLIKVNGFMLKKDKKHMMFCGNYDMQVI